MGIGMGRKPFEGKESGQNAKQVRSDACGDQMIGKWRDDMKRILNEVVALYHSRSIYNRLSEIAEANPDFNSRTLCTSGST